ncbi:MAG: recombination protein NinG [Nanoarchaeota archaeon]
MKVRIDKADLLFSRWIRIRDKQCIRCSSAVEINDMGMPVTHQASHYYGRSREATRFEPNNVDTLCMSCHRIWGSDDREAYREFKLRQLGKKRFNSLMLQANTYKKRDRKFEIIKWRLALKEYD